MTTNLSDTASYREREQKARIRELTKGLASRDAAAFLDAQRYARENADDLDAIETNTREALENLIAAINETNDVVDADNRPAVAAAMSIERMAYAAFVATL